MPVLERVERVALTIEKEGVIASIRLRDIKQIIRAFNSLLLGGVNIFELPVQAPKWSDVVKKARDEFGNDIILGVGGILDRRSALNAIQAGADYVSSPHTERGIVELCKEEGAVVMQGGLTPNEVYRAQQTGADYITVAPANLYGESYVEQMIFTYGNIKLVPQGGIDEKGAAILLRAGARAVVVDSWLVNDELIKRRDFDEIQQRAAALRKTVTEARKAIAAAPAPAKRARVA